MENATKTKDEILRLVKDFADEAHGEQMRKYVPQRYIVHPIEVMEICSRYTDDISVLSAALLHDVLEDTPTTQEEIETFLLTLLDKKQTEKAIRLTVELTDIYTKAAYPHLNRRARKEKEHERSAQNSPDAQTIKYADIISNSVDITKHDKNFGPRFLREVKSQLKTLDKGNPELYQLAVETVERCLVEMSRK